MNNGIVREGSLSPSMPSSPISVSSPSCGLETIHLSFHSHCPLAGTGQETPLPPRSQRGVVKDAGTWNLEAWKRAV